MTKHTAIERSQRPPSTADLEACGPAGDAAAERITLYFSTEIDQFIETKYSGRIRKQLRRDKSGKPASVPSIESVLFPFRCLSCLQQSEFERMQLFVRPKDRNKLYSAEINHLRNLVRRKSWDSTARSSDGSRRFKNRKF